MKPVIIAGICVIQDEFETLEIAKKLADISSDIIFKASFDKANRTNINSYRGVGRNKALNILERVKKETNLKITTDIHETHHANMVKSCGVDIIQIPAFLCKQTDLLLAAKETGCIVNVKKGQFINPEDTYYIANKLNPQNAWITERGTSFGYNNTIVDMNSISVMKDYFQRVILDLTHTFFNYPRLVINATKELGCTGYFMECNLPNSMPKADKGFSFDMAKDLINHILLSKGGYLIPRK